jgi:DNA-directed RNA polymerase subunit RPC12/RpoP
MTTKQSRFFDPGKPLAAYAHKVLVVCPNCAGLAIVRNQMVWTLPFRTEYARVHCLRCSFLRESPSETWYGPVIGCAKQRCSYCGYKWLTTTRHEEQGDAMLPHTASVTCPACQHTTTIALQWFPQAFTGAPIDPTFGLPLWLQLPCCGHTLWAYNEEHLATLRAYVTATHRIPPPNNKWSMFTRLPRWIKAAKNRGVLLKCCDRLEQRLREGMEA